MRKVEREKETKSRESEEDCKDGEHCEFKQIKEADLLQHLRDGSKPRPVRIVTKLF